jgi:LCP family protein required for cell wall assembly
MYNIIEMMCERMAPLMKRKALILIALLLVSGVSYVAYTIYQVLNPETLFETQPHTEEDVDNNRPVQNDKEVSVHIQQPEEQYRFDEDRINILLLGLDADQERYETMRAFRTDTIILLSIDFQANQVYLISIPRDSYVKIPGRQQRDRINTAFVWGGGFNGKGFERTIETVSDFLGGIPIHYYVGIDMNAFVEIVDIMGGVEFEVDVPVKIGGRELKPGLQRLNGQQVLDYCRNRHFPWGDIQRVKNQQKMLLAMFDQLKSSKQLLNVSKYYEVLKSKVYTNLNAKQIAALGVFGMKLDLSNIHTYSIPGDFLNIDGIGYWGVNQYGKKDLVKEIFGVEIEIDPKDDVRYIKRELEEKLKALAAAISEANDVINKAQEVMSTYSAYIKEEEKAGVESRIGKVRQSIDVEDTASIKTATRELKNYIDNLSQIFEQRKKEDEERKAHEQVLAKARKDAQQVIQWVTAQIEKKGDRLSHQDRQRIEASIASVNEALKGQNVQDIMNKTAELKKQAEAIFNAMEQQKEEGNSSPPQDATDGSNGSQVPENDEGNSQVPDDNQETPGNGQDSPETIIIKISPLRMWRERYI